jgi:hypothetical protein
MSYLSKYKAGRSHERIVCTCIENDFRYSDRSNVVVERLTLLPRTRHVSGSNLGPETGYTD